MRTLIGGRSPGAFGGPTRRVLPSPEGPRVAAGQGTRSQSPGRGGSVDGSVVDGHRIGLVVFGDHAIGHDLFSRVGRGLQITMKIGDAVGVAVGDEDGVIVGEAAFSKDGIKRVRLSRILEIAFTGSRENLIGCI